MRIFLIKTENLKSDCSSLNLVFLGNYYTKPNFIVGKYFKVAVVGKKVKHRYEIKFMEHEA